MKTFYIPVHYFERERDCDSFVIFITQYNIADDDFERRLRGTAKRYSDRQENYVIVEEIADAIFNALAIDIGGAWSYCNTVSTLTLGDFREQPEMPESMEIVTIPHLAVLMSELKPGENIEFYEENVKSSDNTVKAYNAVMIDTLGRRAVYIDYYGNGTPYDITIKFDGAEDLEKEIHKYLTGKKIKRKHVYVEKRFLKDFSEFE